MNKVELIGRLTKDPEIRYTQSNTPVANYTIAVNRRFKKEGEQEADFINCISWNKSAEFVEKHFKKGQQIGIVGRIQTRTYEDNGQKKFITEIITEELFFADSKKEEPVDVTDDVYNDTLVTEGDDLPF